MTPKEAGLPERFGSFRPNQLETVMAAMESPARHVAIDAPTGSGKSLLACSYATLTGLRTLVLTATKALQSTYHDDYQTIGMVDVRGQNAYPCVAWKQFDMPEDTMVDAGPCHAGVRCALKNTDCRYYLALRKADQAQVVVTNYQFWMMHNMHAKQKLRPFDVLILDEAHDAENELSSALTVELSEWMLETLLGKRFPTLNKLEDWRTWAGDMAMKSEIAMENAAQAIARKQDKGGNISKHALREAMLRKRLHRELATLAFSKGQWVVEKRERNLMFAPVWPAAQAEEVLFCDVPKVILMSATLRPKTLDILGIKEYTFIEVPSSFPVANRPVYHVPTVRMNHRTQDAELQRMVDRIDEIIVSRLDRKGIIHAVSYKRRDFLMEHSNCRELLYSHEREKTRSEVEKFKKLEPPAVFVSPSISTGWDFPDDAARYCIIPKLPYPDTRSPIMKAKCEADREYQDYVVAQTIVQMAGRVVRSAEDRGEVFILDDNWVWFIHRNRHLFPEWFLKAVRTSIDVPPPIKLD